MPTAHECALLSTVGVARPVGTVVRFMVTDCGASHSLPSSGPCPVLLAPRQLGVS
jgi:hypothetical protein